MATVLEEGGRRSNWKGEGYEAYELNYGLKAGLENRVIQKFVHTEDFYSTFKSFSLLRIHIVNQR